MLNVYICFVFSSSNPKIAWIRRALNKTIEDKVIRTSSAAVGL